MMRGKTKVQGLRVLGSKVQGPGVQVSVFRCQGVRNKMVSGVRGQEQDGFRCQCSGVSRQKTLGHTTDFNRQDTLRWIKVKGAGRMHAI